MEAGMEKKNYDEVQYVRVQYEKTMLNQVYRMASTWSFSRKMYGLKR